MPDTELKTQWERYVATERQRISMLLKGEYALDDFQPQTIGERYLTRPVGSGRKVVFFGCSKNGMRVVIKTSREEQGIAELMHEERVHEMLSRIQFAYEAFSLPRLLPSNVRAGILVSEYIDQDKPFLDRPLREQFNLALRAFKAQESAHAVTAEHWESLQRLMRETEYYIKPSEYRKAAEYGNDVLALLPPNNPDKERLSTLFDTVLTLINEHSEALERYDSFLTHWDFMPQNFRVKDGKLYLLDLTSMRFGNKYEGWARFINFMTLYHPPLAQALVDYVHLNRTKEEARVLTVMRAYRLVELIRYYATWIEKTTGDTLALAEARISFWTDVLAHVLKDKPIPNGRIEAYKTVRDALRSEEEKLRQKGLH